MGIAEDWRNRFEKEGIEGLHEPACSGRPTVFDKSTIDRVLFFMTKHIPEEATYWSIELMGKYAEVTSWQVLQRWSAADLRPHRLKIFKISNDPHFSNKIIDIVGLYMNPPENAIVLSVDEKTQIEAFDRTQPGPPLRPIRIGCRTHNYKRHDAASESWLNALEGWIAQQERALYPGVFASVSELELEHFIKAHHTKSAKPYKWTKPAGKILESVRRAKKSLQN